MNGLPGSPGRRAEKKMTIASEVETSTFKQKVGILVKLKIPKCNAHQNDVGKRVRITLGRLFILSIVVY